MENRKASVASKKSYLDKDYNDDSFDPKSSMASPSYDQSLFFQRNNDRLSSTISPGLGYGHKFFIKEVKTLQSITFYNIEGSVNGQTVSKVSRRIIFEIYLCDFLQQIFQQKQFQIKLMQNTCCIMILKISIKSYKKSNIKYLFYLMNQSKNNKMLLHIDKKHQLNFQILYIKINQQKRI